MTGGASEATVGVFTRDLMVRSRLPQDVRWVRTPDNLDGLAMLLVDLNRELEPALAAIGEARRRGGAELKIICFGAHLELPALRDRALAAGADRCVANSHLTTLLQRRFKEDIDGPRLRP